MQLFKFSVHHQTMKQLKTLSKSLNIKWHFELDFMYNSNLTIH